MEEGVSDLLQPFSGDNTKQTERYRELGYTAGQVAPQSGVFRGSGTVILLLDDQPVTEMILADDVAQHLAFDRGWEVGQPDHHRRRSTRNPHPG